MDPVEEHIIELFDKRCGIGGATKRDKRCWDSGRVYKDEDLNIRYLAYREGYMQARSSAPGLPTDKKETRCIPMGLLLRLHAAEKQEEDARRELSEVSIKRQVIEKEILRLLSSHSEELPKGPYVPPSVPPPLLEREPADAMAKEKVGK